VAPYFCQQNTDFLAVAFHIYTTTTHPSTDCALFLIILKQKLCLNRLGPLLHHISYVFGPHDVFGLVIFSGNVEEWYGHLKEDSLLGLYGGRLEILFVTWLIFNDEIEREVPFNIDLARYFSWN
jgi:hypothetical protein